MKLAATLFIAAMLAACQPPEMVVASDGIRVPKTFSGNEQCYEGVVYVLFSGGNTGWGGVKFDKQGKVVTCN